MRIGVFTTDQARLLWQDYLQRMRSTPLGQHRFPEFLPRHVQCELTAPLSAATDGWLAPTTATARVYSKIDDGTEMAETDREITIVNRSPDISLSVGEYCRAEWIDGEWQPYLPSGGGETQIINFQITSSDPNTRRALVQVEQRAFRGQVYGSILNDEVVYVYDTRGCYLNKKNEDLTGRFGSAVLMYTDDAAAELHFSEQYEPPEKYWCVLDVCCPNIVCED